MYYDDGLQHNKAYKTSSSILLGQSVNIFSPGLKIPADMLYNDSLVSYQNCVDIYEYLISLKLIQVKIRTESENLQWIWRQTHEIKML